jgi:transcriptional regulator with XRE-family HTH domain
MPTNRVFKLRKRAKLTQRELAARVGTSQQQIQRIEAGAAAVRLDIATRIASALGLNVHAVFPGLPRSTRTRAKGRKKPINAGVGLAEWSIKLFMFDGRKFEFQIAGGESEKDRLESIISSRRKRFIVFNTHDRIIAVKRSKIAACHFLYDLPWTSDGAGSSDSYKLTLHLVSAASPISFELEPDSKTLEEDDDGMQSQMQFLMMNIDGNDDDESFCFDDVDGERVYIRADEVLVIDLPHVCCEPSLLQKSLRGMDEAQRSPAYANAKHDAD